MQLSEYCVNGCRKADCLCVLQTTFMEPCQSWPPELICYTETVDRNCIQHEYQQQVILMSNVNPILAVLVAVRSEVRVLAAWFLRSQVRVPLWRALKMNQLEWHAFKQHQCALTEFLLGNFPGSQLPSRLYSKLCFACTPRSTACLYTHLEMSHSCRMKP